MGIIHPSQLQRGMVIIDRKSHGDRIVKTLHVVKDVIPPVRGQTCSNYHIHTVNGGHWCWDRSQAIEIQD